MAAPSSRSHARRPDPRWVGWLCGFGLGVDCGDIREQGGVATIRVALDRIAECLVFGGSFKERFLEVSQECSGADTCQCAEDQDTGLSVAD